MGKARSSAYTVNNRSRGHGRNGRGSKARLQPINTHVQMVAARSVGGSIPYVESGSNTYYGGRR